MRSENIGTVVFQDFDYGAFAITCSINNMETVREFIGKRYPDWKEQCRGIVGATPWNNVLDVLGDMKELLHDEALEFKTSITVISV